MAEDDFMTDRAAVITDIHANLPALEEALTRIDELGIERIYCGGAVRGAVSGGR
jgi:hypothetical protein